MQVEQASSEDLHPFMSAGAGHAPTSDEVAQRTFGLPTIDTQGPAGSRVPDLDDRPRRARFGGEEEEVEYGYDEAGDAPPDAAGPHSPLDVEMTTADYQTPAGDAAAAAVLAAARSGRRGSAAMMDALEAAEAAFDDAEGRRGAAGGSLGVGSGAGAGYEDAAAAPPPPDTPRKAAICEATRERIIQKVFEALQANPRYSGEPARDCLFHAQSIEDAIFAHSHSKQVYLNQVSNAVRLSRTVEDAADVPRIARGEPRAVAEGHTAGEPTPYTLGLQILKPDF